MITTLASLLHFAARPTNEADAFRLEWANLLAAASSPQERDEINDLFGRAAAA